MGGRGGLWAFLGISSLVPIRCNETSIKMGGDATAFHLSFKLS